MSAIGRLVRTTAFKLTLLYLAVFAALAVALITYIATTTQELIDSQFNSAIEAEIRALAEQYQTGGLQRLIRAVERRSVRPDASVYLITDFAGNRVAGNIASLSASAAIEPSGEPIPVLYQRLTPTGETIGEEEQRRAVARVFVLKGNFQLLVGRDVEERIEFAQIIRQAMRAAIAVIVVLALLSWMFVSRSVLKKIDAIAESGRSFVAGNLSGRLPTDGTG
ncbi:MAG TPA: two-component sensor histidine kinase, partial [Gammaproteobacteria bacterium]|nr:two-component sensor histidine kinase [Gammaproteobacteria bacterium]